MKATVGSALALAIATALPAGAQEASPDAAAELAKKLANPVASLISVPLQYNYDMNFGPNDDGSKSLLNVQPVVPLSLGDNWNLIVRTIAPLIDQNDVPVTGVDRSGTGDIIQSFFLSPKETVGGWILAAGPVGLYPSASDALLGGEKWGLGPTALALQQRGPWTYGMLTNHLVSVAGEETRGDVNSTFLQPFLVYITKTKTTLSFNTESTYDWENEQWSVPLNAAVAQMLKAGSQLFQVAAGARYWADSPVNGPEDWGFRAVLTLLFPK